MTTHTTSTRLSRRLAISAGVGLLFALAWAGLMATFPLLTGSELHARVQSAVITGLGFPLLFAARWVVPAAGRLGLAPFGVGVGLAFVNGALWAAAVVAVRRFVGQRPDSGVGILPPAA
jgi:hypothetical protein